MTKSITISCPILRKNVTCRSEGLGLAGIYTSSFARYLTPIYNLIPLPIKTVQNYTMVGLLSLSNELLIHVFSSCTTITQVACLSIADDTLNSIWLRYKNQIATSVLRQQIPEYEDAVELAILEEIWINKNTRLASIVASSTNNTKIPVGFYAKRLLHNASLAMSATDAREAVLADIGSWVPGTLTLLAPNRLFSPHAAYYLMRKIALAYSYPEAQLQDTLYSTLRGKYSEADAEALDQFCSFLCDTPDDSGERGRHGIDKPRSEWTDDDAWNEGNQWGYVIAEPWKYVEEVINSLINGNVPELYTLEERLGVADADTVAV
jgi:hypothetical protein